ncbi:MAG: hypothetical protein P8Y70_21310 [Candidatus Lokiarchaeota archaeon]
MTQLVYEKEENKFRIDLEEVLIEDIELGKKEIQRVREEKVNKAKGKISKALNKLMKKSKNNVNYMKDTKSIQDKKAQINYRTFAVY